MRRVLGLLCLLVIGFSASQEVRAGDKAAELWLGLIAGPAASSETVLAADMASLFPQGAELRVLPMLGDSGAGNLALLLNDPDVDIAFVSTDALFQAAAKDKGFADKLELVARLFPQEVHVLARSEIGSLSGLTGKKVNFGPEGSAAAVTAEALFKAFGLKVEATSLDAQAAIEQLKQGAISAALIIGGKPLPLVSAIPITAGIQLLPVSFGSPLESAYLPTRLEAADYPNLIRQGSEVATVATGTVLLAARSKGNPESRARIERFVAAVFPRFAELQVRHPKWREVNLAASLSGFKRTPAAEAWLAAHSEVPVRPVAATANAREVPSLTGSLLTSKEQQEALFRRFIEWQRGKER